MTTAHIAEWPFVGRAVELEHLQRLLGDPACCGVIVAGASGVGRTRLAAEGMRLARGAGYRVARVTAMAAQSGIPLGAVAHLLPMVRFGTVYDQTTLVCLAQAELMRLADGLRLMLVVDDADLLDDTSATLIYRVMLANQAFVLLTLRAGAPQPQALVSAWKDELVERIELAGLDESHIAGLLDAVLGAVDPDTVALLSEQAEQDILVLRELVAGAVRDGTLANEDGLWRLRRQLRPSARLIEVIEMRLAGLKPADRALVDIIAVGEPLALTELSEVIDTAGAQGLERDGIITGEVVAGRLVVRLAHSIYGAVLRAQLPVLQVQSIAARLAAAIDRSAQTARPDVIRTGRLLMLSDGGDPATLLAAARFARWSYAIELAVGLTAAAIARGAGFEAELLAAELAGLQGRRQEAKARLAHLAATAQGDDQRGRVAVAELDNLLYAGAADEQVSVSRVSDQTIHDLRWLEQIQAHNSPVLVMTEGPEVTWAAVRGVVDRGDDHGAAFVWAVLTGAHALGRMGQTERALELTDRGYVAHLALAEPLAWYPWFHLFNRCELLVEAGRLADAETLGREQYRLAIVDHSGEAQAAFASQLARILVARGRVASAAQFARIAMVIFRDLERPMFQRQSAQRLAAALGFGGHLREAEEALSIASSATDGAFMYDAVDLLHTRAGLASAAGHTVTARRLLEEMAALATTIGDLVGLSTALHTAGRITRANGLGPLYRAMHDLVPRMDSGLFSARYRHLRGLATGDPQILEDAALSFADLGANLLAAEAAADAAGRWEQSGHARRRTAATYLARGFLLECEGAASPRLPSIGAPAVLTGAERDTAELAARGYSNKDIANELILSVRSVENRLQRTYEKLGINSRGQLLGALRRQGS